MTLSHRTAAALAFLLVPILAGAQSPAREPIATDSTGKMYRLADGVFAITHSAATPDWPHGNTGVVIGRDGVLVIDSDYLPDRAEMDLALIRKVTNLPVKWLVNTHWHGDHTHGNGVYQDAFPGLTIIGPRASAHFVEVNLVKLPKGSLFPDSYNRTVLAQLEATLARGADTTGRRLTDQERRDLQENIAARRNELVQLARVKVVPPNLLFDGAMTLDLGNRRVELRDMGRANSPHDVVIWLPDERVLFTGDILVHPLPFTGGASPLPWITVLQELEKYPVTSLVPGHGPPMSDHRYTTLVRETFEMVRAQVDAGYRAGYPLVQLLPRITLDDQRQKFVRVDGSVVSQAGWDNFVRTVAQFLGECYQGYRC